MRHRIRHQLRFAQNRTLITTLVSFQIILTLFVTTSLKDLKLKLEKLITLRTPCIENKILE